MGVMVTSSQVVPAAAALGEESCSCCRVGYLPWETSPMWLTLPHMQSFQGHPAPTWAPPGSQILPGHLLQYGLPSPWVSRSLPGPCSNMGFPQVHSLLPALVWVPPWAAGGSGHPCALHVLQGHSCLTRAAGNLSTVPGALPAPPCVLTWVSAGLFPSHILILLFSGCNYFCTIPFSPSICYQRHYSHHWMARPWPAVGQSWNGLALALPDIGEASGSSSQKPLL